ncbi:DinB family protein [Hyunsoonleella pacifica]|uniref:DinB family protein n=1 Tax=Hyunsoonleella pacifica TaxID=1080224 RepID=A0A4Q9FPU5_9FLAO|nr:DinB family protein [Hyunsoonleella pacifica]TBN15823.1 DinB family protein [Hyunsoonleella pacifica]GGD22934.1 DNA damage-inducible protein DinB [Hyunsoonleella pacifica]
MQVKDLKFIPKFYDRYINLVDNDIDLLSGLKDNISLFDNYKEALIEHQNLRYQAEKWTPKELLQHVIDTERIFCYRVLAISRSEPKNIMGFDENQYAKNSRANSRTIDSLLNEFRLVRQATIALFESLDASTLHLTGICSNIKISSGAYGFIMIGHTIHHLNILKQRYF